MKESPARTSENADQPEKFRLHSFLVTNTKEHPVLRRLLDLSKNAREEEIERKFSVNPAVPRPSFEGMQQRRIEQAYVLVPRESAGADRLAKARKALAAGRFQKAYELLHKKIRIRKTTIVQHGSDKSEAKEPAFRLAAKSPIPGAPKHHKYEKQEVIDAADTFAIGQCESLLAAATTDIPKSVVLRTYIPHTFSHEGVTYECEIHYDITEAPEGVQGLERVEIEFSSAEAEKAFVQAGKGAWPPYVLDDVTEVQGASYSTSGMMLAKAMPMAERAKWPRS